MKICYIFNGFSENMGYASNCLPEAVANLGHEVHSIAPNVQVYYNSPFYDETYKHFLGDAITKIESKKIGKFTLHRLPHKTKKSEVDIKFLYKKLKEINPDVVHVFQLNSIITIKSFLYKFLLHYKLFTGNHTVLSVFPLDKEWNNLSFLKKTIWSIKHRVSGNIISRFTEKCYPATIDAKYIANKYFGVPNRKMKIAPIGVRTDIFYPLKEKQLDFFSSKFKIPNGSFVCIYTGRFTNSKNPLILGKAIDLLAKKHPNIYGLFIGDGSQKEKLEELDNCIFLPFQNSDDLAQIYQNSHIGIWPREESMSMLDASASGLPIIVSNNIKAKERVDGNGLEYLENDFVNLSKKIETLFLDKSLYTSLSKKGAEKIETKYSWNIIAKERLNDYELALSSS